MLRSRQKILLSFLFFPVMPLLADGQGHFENFSIKQNVSGSNGTIVSKFSLDGTQMIIVRALGPSLARHGVANPLMDPILELHNATGAIIASDDNWPDKQLAQFNGPYRAFQPPDRREAAIAIRLEAGSYTAVVRGKSGARGVASAEVYSASVNNDSRIANISSRALVLSGGNALVGTLTVGGNSSVDMIVRALGPSLARSGITNFLRDPTLALYDHTGRFVRYNDNWRNDQAQAEEIMASGLAPAQPAEAAMSVTLAPGTYTVVVRGSQNSTGVGSFEAYRVRQHQVKPSPTPTPVPAPSPTATPTPTATPSPVPSLTPAPTATPTPFPTPTPTQTPTQTPTPTATPTSTPTPDATATPGPSHIPHGVFSLVKASGNIDSDTLTNPSVDGISLREHWCDLEPSEGVFDWSYFDSQIARAAAAGKDVLLRVVDGGDCIPVWVMSAVASDGGSTFTFSDSDGQHVIPVFWDATFLAKKEAMIAAVGSRYTNNPAVKIACASFANAVTGDWNVPSNQSPDSPYTISEVSRWFNAGYTTQKMLDAGKSVIDATMQAFPNQLVLLAINSNGNVLDYPHDNNYVAQTAAANARLSWGSDRLIVSKYNLSNKTPTPPGFGSWTVWYDSEAASGAQALWSFYGDTTYRNSGGTPVDPATGLERSIDIGMSYGMKFMEIYQIDVVNLPEAINYAHNKL